MRASSAVRGRARAPAARPRAAAPGAPPAATRRRSASMLSRPGEGGRSAGQAGVRLAVGGDDGGRRDGAHRDGGGGAVAVEIQRAQRFRVVRCGTRPAPARAGRACPSAAPAPASPARRWPLRPTRAPASGDSRQAARPTATSTRGGHQQAKPTPRRGTSRLKAHADDRAQRVGGVDLADGAFVGAGAARAVNSQRHAGERGHRHHDRDRRERGAHCGRSGSRAALRSALRPPADQA